MQCALRRRMRRSQGERRVGGRNQEKGDRKSTEGGKREVGNGIPWGREAGGMTEFFTTLCNILQQKIARCTNERDIKDGLKNRK